MIAFVLIIIVAICIIQMLRKRKMIVSLFIIALAGILLLAIHIGGKIINRNDPMGKDIIPQIKNIPWDDEEYLKKIGFFENDDEEIIQYFSENIEDEWPSFFHIYVEKMGKEQAIEEYDLKEKDGIYIAYSEANEYADFISFFLSRPSGDSRYYYIYQDERLISVREHSEPGDKLFENFIKELDIKN